MSDRGLENYDTAIGYMTGYGREKDVVKGAEFMKMAADDGYMPAIRDLGVILVNGDGLPQDIPEGVKLISKAVEAMDPRAFYNMALLYRDGIGVKKDLFEALRLMGFAAGMKVSGAEEDAEKIETAINEDRKRRLDSRPILHLEISDKDIEACCCRKMYDAALSREIYHVDSYKGPVLMKEDEKGDEVLVPCCPFCMAPIRIVSHDKVY